MGVPMNAKEFARFILPVMRKEWDQEMSAQPSAVMGLFDVMGSTTSEEYSQGLGAFDLVPEYNSADAEGKPGTIEYDSFAELYEKTFTHKEYAKGTEVERKLFDDNKTGLILKKARTLGLSFGRTRAVHAASVFNNAFSASYLGADAVALCSASHPVNKVSSTTFSNLGTSALSYDAVIATLIAGQSQNDDRGNPMPIIYDTLLVPVALQGTAIEILKAVNKPGTADNDANALQYIQGSPLGVIIEPYFTDNNNWFMVDSRQTRMHLMWYNRVLPEFAMDPTSDFNLKAKYRGYMRYSFGWDDARFIYGHNVT